MAASRSWTNAARLSRAGRNTRAPRRALARWVLPACVGAGLCAGLTAAPAWALPDDACIKDDRCKEHYSKAVKYYKDEYFEEALTEFQAAYASRQMPLLLINIGRKVPAAPHRRCAGPGAGPGTLQDRP